jgi:hypothetical protein
MDPDFWIVILKAMHIRTHSEIFKFEKIVKISNFKREEETNREDDDIRWLHRILWRNDDPSVVYPTLNRGNFIQLNPFPHIALINQCSGSGSTGFACFLASRIRIH